MCIIRLGMGFKIQDTSRVNLGQLPEHCKGTLLALINNEVKTSVQMGGINVNVIAIAFIFAQSHLQISFVCSD